MAVMHLKFKAKTCNLATDKHTHNQTGAFMFKLEKNTLDSCPVFVFVRLWPITPLTLKPEPFI